MTTKSVLIVIGEFSAASAIGPYQILQTLAYGVDLADPDKTAGKKVKTSILVYIGDDRMYTERRGRDFVTTIGFDEVDAANYDGLVLPGGRAPEYLAADEDVGALVRAFDDAGKPIAANCHGTQIIAGAEIVDGKRCTGLSRLRPVLENAGAEFVEPKGSTGDQTGAVVDGNLITGPQSSTYPEMMRPFIKQLDPAADWIPDGPS